MSFRPRIIVDTSKPTHLTDDLPEYIPCQLAQHKQHARGKVESHRPSLPEHAEDNVRHHHEVQKRGDAWPNVRKHEERRAVHGFGRVRRPEGGGDVQCDVQRDVRRRDEERKGENTEGLRNIDQARSL